MVCVERRGVQIADSDGLGAPSELSQLSESGRPNMLRADQKRQRRPSGGKFNERANRQQRGFSSCVRLVGSVTSSWHSSTVHMFSYLCRKKHVERSRQCTMDIRFSWNLKDICSRQTAPQASDPGFCDASEHMGGRRRVGWSKERSDVIILMGKYQIILPFKQVKQEFNVCDCFRGKMAANLKITGHARFSKSLGFISGIHLVKSP